MRKFLVVDDDPPLLLIMSRVLRGAGREVLAASSGADALALVRAHTFDVILTDLRMQPMDGLQLLEAVRNLDVRTPVVFITACDSIETAMQAMKGGAFDYVVKPLRIPEVQATVERALQYRNRLAAPADAADRGREGLRLRALVASSPAMRDACDMLERLALTNASLLLLGESGSGRRTAAQALHAASHRREQRFVLVDCAAKAPAELETALFGPDPNGENAFQQAEGGTLCLHEVGALPSALQPRLVRVLRDRKTTRPGGKGEIAVDVRVLATAGEGLAEQAQRGRFDAELHHRLSLIPIAFPPLRERREDILPLAFFFLHGETPRDGRPRRLEAEAQQALEAYLWPGNVRELKDAMRIAASATAGGEIGQSDLPVSIRKTGLGDAAGAPLERRMDDLRGRSFSTFLREKERQQIQLVLEKAGGDKEHAAQSLGISVATLERKLKP